MSDRNKKVTAFLTGTKNTMPRNVQDRIVRTMNYRNMVEKMINDGGRYKNLMNHGFFNPRNYSAQKNRAKSGNKLAKSMVDKYNRSRNKIVEFLMDNKTKLTNKEKKNIVTQMLRNKTWDDTKRVFVNDLKYIKTNGDLKLITNHRKNFKYANVRNLNFSWRKLKPVTV
jgi:hypothetical protein